MMGLELCLSDVFPCIQTKMAKVVDDSRSWGQVDKRVRLPPFSAR